MIVMVPVLASLFLVSLISRALMGRRQVGCATSLRTYGAQRNQSLHIFRFTDRARYPSVGSPLEMLKPVIALKALILENRHKPTAIVELTRPSLKTIESEVW
jgi:hypothetical protein